MNNFPFPKLSILIFILLTGCQEREPLNPLDPDNPNTNGQAYTISAEVTGIGKVKVHWKKVNQSQVKGYRLYSYIEGAEPSLIAEVNDTLFVTTGLPPGKACSYFYRLVWVDGREFHQSPDTSVVTFNAPAGFTITKLTRDRVEMQWNNLQWLDNYSYCRIYRNSDGTFYLYDSTSSNQYIDTNVGIGITYSYKVAAVAKDGSQSNLSDEGNATPGNNSPVIDSLKASQPFTNWGEEVTITCYAHDEDGDPITYSWEALDGGIIIVSAQTITFRVPQDTILTHRVKVTVTDGYSAASTSIVTIESAQILLTENFESYTIGTFPTSGGWSLVYSGLGASSQYVDNVHSVSGTQSLHLVGSSCWGASVFRSVSIPSRVRLEGEIFVDQIVSCGCDNNLVLFGLEDPSRSWGIFFGEIAFDCDGKIYAGQGSNAQWIYVMPYSAHTWYHVRLDIDLKGRSFDVYINNVRKGSNLQISDSGMPTGVGFWAAHGGNPTVWFDDLKLFSN